MKKIVQIVLLVSCLSLSACQNPFKVDSVSTVVEIIVIDETGTLNDNFIKSIYDPQDDQDYRYVKFDNSKYVKFKDVEPGNYRAHACPVSLNTGNWADITVGKGDHYKITFIYFIDGYVTISGITLPHYWWKNSVEKN